MNVRQIPLKYIDTSVFSSHVGHTRSTARQNMMNKT